MNVPLVFESKQLNVGDAMDLKTGKFKAPRAGRYFFSFSGLSEVQPNLKGTRTKMNMIGLDRIKLDRIASFAYLGLIQYD